ncbi:hypothetical protein OH807_03655 [Kitasatospora sp. NBC_01560]|uniref:hypothetical protein n=1 Tax=Kitasatospora sp. NBC_01560 TaxID=2975965 RepID=UPI0038659736
MDRLPVAMSGTVALAAGGALAVGLVRLGELHSGWSAYAACIGLSALLGAFSRPSAAPVIGMVVWLCRNAFAEHRHAELGWSGVGAESGHYALFTAAALFLALPPAVPRRAVRVARLSIA